MRRAIHGGQGISLALKLRLGFEFQAWRWGGEGGGAEQGESRGALTSKARLGLRREGRDSGGRGNGHRSKGETEGTGHVDRGPDAFARLSVSHAVPWGLGCGGA
jgi:hypothetical protein